MNINELLHESDPAAGIPIPTHDSPLAQRAMRQRLPPAQHRPPCQPLVTVALLVAVITAAAAIGLVSLPSSAPASAASVVFKLAAAAASHQAPLVLRPGEYLYTKTRSLSDTSWAIGNGHAFYTEYVYTESTWQTAAGKGRTITAYNSPVTFLDGTRKVWIRAGRPEIVPPSRRQVAPANGIRLDNLAHLPTDPPVLLQVIEQHKTGLTDINADVEDPSTPGGAFYVALLLLTQPAVGSFPQLRAALFKIMASLPGDEVIGPAATRSGRRGIAILTPPPSGPGTAQFKVIIDPAKGVVLEYDEYAHPGAHAEQWSEFLSAGVVHKIGQLARRP